MSSRAAMIRSVLFASMVLAPALGVSEEKAEEKPAKAAKAKGKDKGKEEVKEAAKEAPKAPLAVALQTPSYPKGKKARIASFAPQVGHTRPITSIGASANGAVVATASGFDDGVVKVWNGETGELMHDLHAEDYVSVSPDGTLIATGEQGGPVKVWDAKTGAEIKALEGASGPLIFTPDGRALLTASSGDSPGVVRRFDVSTWSAQGAWEGHQSSLIALELSKDGQLAASASWDGTVKLWRVANGELARTVQVQDKSPEAIALSPDGARVAIVWQGQYEVEVWDLASSKVVFKLTSPKIQPNHVAWSPDGKRLVTSAPGEMMRVWSAADGTLENKFPGSGALLYAGSGTQLLSGEMEPVRHDPDGGKVLLRMGSRPDNVYRLVFSADGATLVTTDIEQRVDRWELASGKLLGTLRLPTTTMQDGVRVVNAEIVLAPGGKLAALRDFGKPDIRVWDLTRDMLSKTISTDGALLHGLSWAPDAREMIITSAADDDHTQLVWWSLFDGKALNRSRSDGSVRSAGFVDGGKNVALVTTGAMRNARLGLKVWERETNMVRSAKIPDIAPFAGDISFAPKGMLVALADSDNSIKLWDRAKEAVVGQLLKHDGHINLSRFSPDGALLLTSGWDETVRLWDTASGALLWSQRTHLKAQDAAFSPDGKRLAIAHQGWVQVIDLPTGRWRSIWRTSDGWMSHDSSGQYACEASGCKLARFRGLDAMLLPEDDKATKPFMGLKGW